ncbi:expansin-like B1 [Nicotiana sylvestris]|uniref:expansin-like B1 n=1 Tax=Nicotiana sylvestris TaxID=4096 RepID=UPI00388C67B2
MEREMWQQSSTPDPVNLSYRISSLEYPIHNSSNYTSSAFSTSFLRQNDLYQQQYNCIFLCMVLLLPTLCYSNNYVSRTAYYTTPDGMGIPTGACGYGENGKDVNNGEVCAASKRLYKNGAACGACYQVRCKDKGLCSDEGTKVVVTDTGEGHGTDFILSYRAYAKLAKQPNMAQQLFAKGVVEVEYRRVSCKYGNLMLKIHEHSKYPHYLAIVVMNQGGATDILAVQVMQEETKEWISMRRVYGAVFDLSSPPSGELNVRFLTSAGAETKWVQSDKAVIPAEWKAGLLYIHSALLDMKIQVLSHISGATW